MPKFKVGTKVKISKEFTDRLWSHGVCFYPIDIFEIRNVVEREDGATVYDLRKVGTYKDVYEVPQEEITVAEGEELPLIGMAAHDLENHTIGKSLLTVFILGTTYTIETRKVSEDEYMKEKHLSGYCCEESKRIVIADMSEKEYFELDEAEQKSYYKKTLRHELVHAFLNESGLSDNASVPAGAWSKHEEMVDWFAIQSPKIYKTFAELDIL